jgi:rhodanese-related sulfurtransferase
MAATAVGSVNVRAVHELGKDEAAKVFLLDVRSAVEFTGPLGHVAGSVLVPLPELGTRMEEVKRHGGDDKRAVVICRSGGRAVTAANMIASTGAFAAVEVMEGGMIAWNDAGLPVAR